MENIDLIESFFDYISFIGNAENPVDMDALLKYVDPDFVVQSNNEILCRGIAEFMDYIAESRQKYLYVSYSDFLEEPIISGNKAVLHFHVNCIERSGTKSRLDAIAILTIRNRKICFWTEVFQDISCLNECLD